MQMPASPHNNHPAAANEILISRVLNAPRPLVFNAWIDAQHLAHWYGPNGFSISTHEMDARPGGVWRFTMHGPDGTDYPNRVVFTEIVPTHRLAYDHSDDDQGVISFKAVVEFLDEGTGTRVNLRHIFPNADTRNYVEEKYGATEGGIQTLGRLDAYLQKL